MKKLGQAPRRPLNAPLFGAAARRQSHFFPQSRSPDGPRSAGAPRSAGRTPADPPFTKAQPVPIAARFACLPGRPRPFSVEDARYHRARQLARRCYQQSSYGCWSMRSRSCAAPSPMVQLAVMLPQKHLQALWRDQLFRASAACKSYKSVPPCFIPRSGAPQDYSGSSS
jgi:hypothetical protein